MIYVLVAMGLAVAIAGGWGKWEQHRAETAEAQVADRDAKIEQQNAAVQQLKVEGDRRVAEAQKGVKAATQATVKARSEAQRLKSMVGQPTPTGACPSASAVAEVRKGLLP